MTLSTRVPGLELRPATVADVPLVRAFIAKLAEYEQLAHEMVATEEDLASTLFGERPYAEVVLAELEGRPAGFALFFHNYSTFLGKPGLYLEDLFVEPDVRGRGVGKALLVYLARLAQARGCGRFEWWVLDWNEPSIRFYQSTWSPRDGRVDRLPHHRPRTGSPRRPGAVTRGPQLRTTSKFPWHAGHEPAFPVPSEIEVVRQDAPYGNCAACPACATGSASASGRPFSLSRFRRSVRLFKGLPGL